MLSVNLKPNTTKLKLLEFTSKESVITLCLNPNSIVKLKVAEEVYLFVLEAEQSVE